VTPERLGVLVRTRERRAADALKDVQSARARVADEEAALAAIRERIAALDIERRDVRERLRSALAGGGLTVAQYERSMCRAALLDDRLGAASQQAEEAGRRVGAAAAHLSQCVKQYRLAHQKTDQMKELRRVAIAGVERQRLAQEEQLTDDRTVLAWGRRSRPA